MKGMLHLLSTWTVSRDQIGAAVDQQVEQAYCPTHRTGGATIGLYLDTWNTGLLLQIMMLKNWSRHNTKPCVVLSRAQNKKTCGLTVT